MDLKNKTPFECGQTDSFFNLPCLPRWVVDGVSIHLTTAQTNLVDQYLAGYEDAERFYNQNNDTGKRYKRRTIIEGRERTDYVEGNKVKPKTIAEQLKELANDCKPD